jgi:hypothetical protein
MAHYNLIDVPIHFMAGLNDNLIPAKDTFKHYKALHRASPSLATCKPLAGRGHLDFTYGLDQEIAGPRAAPPASTPRRVMGAHSPAAAQGTFSRTRRRTRPPRRPRASARRGARAGLRTRAPRPRCGPPRWARRHPPTRPRRRLRGTRCAARAPHEAPRRSRAASASYWGTRCASPSSLRAGPPRAQWSSASATRSLLRPARPPGRARRVARASDARARAGPLCGRHGGGRAGARCGAGADARRAGHGRDGRLPPQWGAQEGHAAARRALLATLCGRTRCAEDKTNAALVILGAAPPPARTTPRPHARRVTCTEPQGHLAGSARIRPRSAGAYGGSASWMGTPSG